MLSLFSTRSYWVSESTWCHHTSFHTVREELMLNGVVSPCVCVCLQFKGGYISLRCEGAESPAPGDWLVYGGLHLRAAGEPQGVT